MFKRKKKPKPLPHRGLDYQAVLNADESRMCICGRSLDDGHDHPELLGGRAPHNPRQQLITADEASQMTATELVAAAGAAPEALASAMTTIASRFEQHVKNIDSLNRALGEFKQEVILPFREELKYLRYTTGDRLNHVSHDLETYVGKLDKVLWAALRAQGMSDAAIRDFRTEQGMAPEAPRGYELEQHMAKVQAMQETIENLTLQNRRLIGTMTGHFFDKPQETGWVYHEGCQCEVCIDHAQTVINAQAEAARG